MTLDIPGRRGCTYPQGCAAAAIPPRPRCLMHASASDWSYALNGIALGLVTDFSGVTFSQAMFEAVRGVAGSALQFVRFEDAVFTGEADFSGFEFHGVTSFDGARFEGGADFSSVRFHGRTSFAEAWFAEGCTFDGSAFFHDGSAYASQPPVPGTPSVDFTRITCRGLASFDGIWTARDWVLTRARFEDGLIGAARCEGDVLLNETTLDRTVRLTLDTRKLDLRGAICTAPLVLRLRNAVVHLADAVLGAKLTLIHERDPLALPPVVPVQSPAGEAPKLAGLRHVDASQLMLVDVDLRKCRFNEAHNLDLIFCAGCSFAWPPRQRRVLGVISIRPVRRPVLADESAPDGPGPSTLALLYRQLRKGLEDGKNESGAAGFYYGEMEMRRHPEAEDTTATERWLLHTYWLLSGYGVRATRALGWLLAAVLATITLIMAVGLPDADPVQTVMGNVPTASGRVVLTVKTPAPELTLPLHRRFTDERANAALKVVLNSVVFRSSDQNLTTWGTYIEMTSRFAEPVLLALAGLAVYGRIRRN
ncbi:pentapeptide repeat-containing protein [Streptomyces sp. NPDC005474]|uniref:pentapeptide repeat-containing protein n=1 Tax=Streptomyces sp. NPDC005474 TaxID=3154878 RepID=UPI003454D08A